MKKIEWKLQENERETKRKMPRNWVRDTEYIQFERYSVCEKEKDRELLKEIYDRWASSELIDDCWKLRDDSSSSSSWGCSHRATRKHVEKIIIIYGTQKYVKTYLAISKFRAANHQNVISYYFNETQMFINWSISKFRPNPLKIMEALSRPLIVLRTNCDLNYLT